MMRRQFYRLLLRLHPYEFRERFASEMLWLFDETLNEAGFLRLCMDAVSSLAKQHIEPDSLPRPARLFEASPRGGPGAARLLQAGLVASLAVFGFLKLLGHPPTMDEPPRTIAFRRSQPETCNEFVHAHRSTGQHYGRLGRIVR